MAGSLVAITKTAGAEKQPKVTVPSKPAPKKLVIKDLKKGFGAVAKWGQRLGVQYVAVDYTTHELFQVSWQLAFPFSFNFGADEVRKGWEIGLKGMRVGGRRELIVPPMLAYGTEPVIYVIELLSIE